MSGSLVSYKDGSLGSAMGLLNERAYSDGSLGAYNQAAYADGSLGLSIAERKRLAGRRPLRGLGCGCATGADVAPITDTSKTLTMGLVVVGAVGLGLFFLLNPRTA